MDSLHGVVASHNGVRFWSPCAFKVLANTENNPSKDGASDLKPHLLCSLSRNNVRLNYMGGMFCPGFQRLLLSSRHFWNGASQLPVTATCTVRLDEDRRPLHFLPHNSGVPFLSTSLTNPRASNERNKAWPRPLSIVSNGLRLYWFGNGSELDGRTQRGGPMGWLEDVWTVASRTKPSFKKNGQRFAQSLHQRIHWMTSKHVKRCLPSWLIRDHAN